MLSFVRLYFSRVFAKYRYLCQDEAIDVNWKRLFQHVVDGVATEDELALSLT